MTPMLKPKDICVAMRGAREKANMIDERGTNKDVVELNVEYGRTNIL